jgi:hypothetical protein
MLEDPAQGLPAIDDLLREIDSIARDYDHYEYGLPLGGEEAGRPIHQFREAVRSYALAAVEAERERLASQESMTNSVASQNPPNVEDNGIRCGRGCACLTQCGDYYDSHGLPLPPGPYALDRVADDAIHAAVMAERERCAAICEVVAAHEADWLNGPAWDCAAAIRNQGKG